MNQPLKYQCSQCGNETHDTDHGETVYSICYPCFLLNAMAVDLYKEAQAGHMDYDQTGKILEEERFKNNPSRQIWGMTRGQFRDKLAKEAEDREQDRMPRLIEFDIEAPHRTDEHAASVRIAYQEGRPVPDDVLAQYPELDKPQATWTAAQHNHIAGDGLLANMLRTPPKEVSLGLPTDEIVGALDLILSTAAPTDTLLISAKNLSVILGELKRLQTRDHDPKAQALWDAMHRKPEPHDEPSPEDVELMKDYHGC